MRHSLLLLAFAATTAFAQVTIEFAPIEGREAKPNEPRNVPHKSCCVPMVYDANGKALGEIIKYDERFQSVPLNAWVRYELKGGDSVALNVAPEAINPPITLGGSAVVFTSNDCSGDAFLAAITPPLTKRYGMVLPVGGTNPGPWAATNAWLYATDPLPARGNAAGIVFHSQWDMTNSCTPYPAPGFTFTGTTWGFWAHKVEDLYAKYKRPFYVP